MVTTRRRSYGLAFGQGTGATMTTDAREVHGYTADGFDRVRDLLAHGQLDEGGASFAVIVHGQLVVDVWAGAADEGVPWESDTVACLYSATKGLVTSCLVQLHADGELDLDAPVVDYWPEFGARGKAGLRVHELLSHGAGLITVPGYAGWLGLHGEGWDQREEIRARLAASEPSWAPGTASGYHGLTYGYLAGALVERVTGQPVPDFFARRLAGPRGLDLRFGLTPETEGRRARQRPAAPLPPDLAAVLAPVQERARDARSLLGQAFFAQDGSTVLEHLAAAGSEPAQMDCGSGNGDALGTARGIAQLYGSLAEDPVLSPSLRAFGSTRWRGTDLVLDVPAHWAAGYMGNAPALTGELTMGPFPDAFGHHGAGGQLGGVDPGRGLAFGFLRSQLSPVSTVARDLMSAVHEALPASSS